MWSGVRCSSRTCPGVSNSTSTTARSDGASSTSSMNVSRSYRPLSPPTSFMRAPRMAKLKIRVFAVLTRYRRTTSPAAAWPANSVSPLISITLPNRPIAVKVGPDLRNGAMCPSSTSRSSRVRVSCRSAAGQ